MSRVSEPDERPLSALPPPRARAAAFVAILLGGLAGGLIGYSLVRVQCDGECALGKGLGAFIGAALAAMDERRRRPRPACSRRVEEHRGPTMIRAVLEERGVMSPSSLPAECASPPTSLGGPAS